ncbi:tyrosine-type recombinase/integrase [Alienimonas chondri]|uniref:tyrosine-type recombinase/integrase n=1 Tax=Alienimonas chondri TaxID=2681879 RepID=UPI0014884249|nr:phage integrase SAM-like domain-containing protein [Alienimonas chondri]
MASISHDRNNGRRTVQFVAPDGKRRSLRLGKVSQKQAEGVRRRVERLVATITTGEQPDGETLAWVEQCPPALHDRLAAVGLVEKRTDDRLGPFLAAYTAERSDLKPRTLVLYRQTREDLEACFGAETPLRKVTEGDAERFRLYLLDRGLAEPTTRRRIGRAKQFFAVAVKRKLIADNPFAGMVSTVRGNRSRMFFVDRETTARVLDCLPSAEWRLIFALSRFGGLRCPSEHLALRWEHLDRTAGRMTVPSPKTERHAGRESRQVPLFPELLPHLDAVHEEAGFPTSGPVLTHRRGTNANLRQGLLRSMKRAKIEPWPRLFHNLRASRQTELAETFPTHVVCAWIGNTQAIAQEHYLQVTDDHFARGASEGGAVPTPERPRNTAPAAFEGGAESGARTGAERDRTGAKGTARTAGNPLKVDLPADPCRPARPGATQLSAQERTRTSTGY